MAFMYEWRQKMVSYYQNSEGRIVRYNDSPKRLIIFRDDPSNPTYRYNVSFSAQQKAGRHATVIETKGFTSLHTAKGFLLELAKKYEAPQNVIDEIHTDIVEA